MERYYMFVDGLNISKTSAVPNLIYRFNATLNFSKLSCGYWQTDSKGYGEAEDPAEPTQL